MKIAISTSGQDLDAAIDPRFGRCPRFLIVDSDTMNVSVLDNQSIAMGGGAGIQAAQSVAGCGVNAVITGNCGPNAVRTLQAAGIRIYLGQSGRAGDALERLLEDDLTPAESPNVADHHGMGGGAGDGMGRRGR